MLDETGEQEGDLTLIICKQYNTCKISFTSFPKAVGRGAALARMGLSLLVFLWNLFEMLASLFFFFSFWL